MVSEWSAILDNRVLNYNCFVLLRQSYLILIAFFSIRRIIYKPAEGVYDLLVSGATYERDNGKFECRLKERGTGIELHSQISEVTVLVPPSAPQINPVNPVAVEGQATELVCSSSGGSPDPVLK